MELHAYVVSVGLLAFENPLSFGVMVHDFLRIDSCLNCVYYCSGVFCFDITRFQCCRNVEIKILVIQCSYEILFQFLTALHLVRGF